MTTLKPKTEIIGATIELSVEELIALNNTIDRLAEYNQDMIYSTQEHSELQTVIEINRKIGDFLTSHYWSNSD